MLAYRNVRTDELYAPEPGSWMAERLAALSEVWQPIEVTDPAEPGAGAQRPAKTARKADWVDYAMSRGYSRDDAESLTRDDLARLLDEQEQA
ncbi:MAG: hypothetical protein ACRDSQ_29115 [Actinokineospora sp.]